MFSIDRQLSALVPGLRLGVVAAHVSVAPSGDGLWAELCAEAEGIRERLAVAQIAEVPEIRGLRAAYRALGQDPQRYRGSAEALMRRALQGKSLYRINSVVDTNNLVSLRSGAAVGSYDLDRISGAVTMRTGLAGESYDAIGRGERSVHRLPVFADERGPFGSPTSDSERTMVRPDTRRIAMVVISFTGDAALSEAVSLAVEGLKAYSDAHQVQTAIVD